MYDAIAMKKFRENLYSIRLAYKIGVFSYEYARNKFAHLYANTFGVFSDIYREMMLSNWQPCFEEE